jgi:protein involved in polysaccharide export with SLBB domain
MLHRLFALCALLFALTACAGHWDEQSPHPYGVSSAGMGQLPLAAAGDYRIATNDKIKVTVEGEAELSGEFPVNKAGSVNGLYVGPIQAAGLTLPQFEHAYASKLREGDILKNPRVKAEITNLRPIYVLGEVKRPGQYAFVNGMTVQKAVALAEGYTYMASENTVEITRSGTKVTIDLTTEMKVMPGDELRVPSRLF